MRGNSSGGSIGSGIGSSGRNDDEATGGDACGVFLWKRGTSHGRGMRSRDEGPICFFTDGLDGGSGIMTVVDGPPVPPEGPESGMNTGDGDLLLIILLRPLRRVCSPLRNVWSFKM